MHDPLAADLLTHLLKRFENIKALGDGALAQLEEADFHAAPGPEASSIAILIQHLHGNMLSRWTDFLTTDGEKPTRARDAEFEAQELNSAELRARWEAGWACLFAAIRPLQAEDLLLTVTIRQAPLTALDALLRQISHLSYHVGQLVYLAKLRRGSGWKTLSIAKGQSASYKPSPKD